MPDTRKPAHQDHLQQHRSGHHSIRGIGSEVAGNFIVDMVRDETEGEVVTGTGKPQYQAHVPQAGRFDKPHAVTRTLERRLDMRGDLRQRVPSLGAKSRS
jgi:hypothetical protein